MSKFSQGFVLDDLEDPVDLVLSTDMDIDMAIEKAEEIADTTDAEDLIKTMEEAGDLSIDLTEDDEDMMMKMRTMQWILLMWMLRITEMLLMSKKRKI